MKDSLTHKSLSSIAPLLLFAVFSACILMVLLSGAQIYRKIAKRDQNSIQCQTISRYLTTRLRQSDAEGMIFVGSFDETMLPTDDTKQSGDTLYLREQLNSRTYYTRIYVHEGMLRELFAADGLTFEPSGGTALLPLKDLHFMLQDGLLTVEITYEDGTAEILRFALRSGSSREKEEKP